MALLTDEIRSYIGVSSDEVTACHAVESSEVRRYTQAVMDSDPIFYNSNESKHFDGPVAPALFPSMMFRRNPTSPDPLTDNAHNPDFDGSSGSSLKLPPLPLPKLAVLNGGSEVEIYRYAKHGETVVAQSRYADIFEKETSKGAMLFVVMETEYRTNDGELLIKNRVTIIRR